MTDFPRMTYRKGGEDSAELHGFKCDTLIVNSADEETAAAKEGYRRTPAEAHGKTPETPQPTDPETADELSAVREELQEFRKDNDDLAAKLRAMTAERDDLKAQIAKFDGDGDGKAGGSKPKLGIKAGA